ncbi:hypothetical protein BB560_005073 [Smittium megazygosporum]|uniref:Peptide-methionine (R)-S-oxide reductase n=1 Tax=Smittium megazygosporum TaxID=133381 RepID=A0A2T9Z7I0_9FUNG|nr:hypothetical protein BB560_005073 [Smittium megazygosporum]
MSIKKSVTEWRAILSPAQFKVLREKGTERAFSGEYNDHFAKEGTYNCAGCEAPLYKATSKFHSHCGWPSFFEALPGAITLRPDDSLFMKRTEIVCTNCGGHLGHLFENEGYKNPTNERHCINSISLKFQDS